MKDRMQYLSHICLIPHIEGSLKLTALHKLLWKVKSFIEQNR
jgi:hypothetical protein